MAETFNPERVERYRLCNTQGTEFNVVMVADYNALLALYHDLKAKEVARG